MHHLWSGFHTGTRRTLSATDMQRDVCNSELRRRNAMASRAKMR